MNTTRKIRFGFQATGEFKDDLVGSAKRAEQIGFDTFLLSDHVPMGVSPMIGLAAVATATERIRLGTMVLNNDMRNPVQLAWEAASIDQISNGRFELGLGAGHTPAEYAGTGIGLDAPAVRKRRLRESTDIIKQLLAGGTVDFEGEFYQIARATSIAPVQDELPIYIGGNGKSLLTHAGRNATTVGLTGMGELRSDGHRHAVKWTVEHLETQLGQINAGASGRSDDVELSCLVQVVDVTDDRKSAFGAVLDRIAGLTLGDAEQTP
ncbi:MAG: TIGR03621 family F420-dependent LLM class oxidoreductase, partial [Actinobacteria bacterium]|nr:TIGR03621 family F420-dependent LLM class oxidoreductase [Actinomycetota bacterium]